MKFPQDFPIHQQPPPKKTKQRKRPWMVRPGRWDGKSPIMGIQDYPPKATPPQK